MDVGIYDTTPRNSSKRLDLRNERRDERSNVVVVGY